MGYDPASPSTSVEVWPSSSAHSPSYLRSPAAPWQRSCALLTLVLLALILAAIQARLIPSRLLKPLTTISIVFSLAASTTLLLAKPISHRNPTRDPAAVFFPPSASHPIPQLRNI